MVFGLVEWFTKFFVRFADAFGSLRCFEGPWAGLLIGLAAALLTALVRLSAVDAIHWMWPVGLSIAGGAIGLVFGALRRTDSRDAARVVDQHYDLKDRSITALQFQDESSTDTIRRLQVEETNQHLSKVDATECVPISASRTQLRWLSGLAAAVALVIFAGSWFAPEVEAKSILPLAQNQSADLRETMLPELEELAKETDDPELDKLVEELEEKLEEMDTQSLDEADLLATLSEMEQSLAEARDAMKLDMTDTMMKALASAMKPSDQMKKAAEAMEAENYEEASEQLKQIDPDQLGDKQRRAVADNMKKMLSKLQPGQQGQLSETISQLAEGLDSKNSSECKKCLSKLASQCKSQGQCKKAGNCMSCQLNRLAQCKSQCRGQCNSNSVAKSNSPSTKAGKGASGQPLGDKATELDSNRQQQQLAGAQGEGPSETEILQAPEGEQQAVRQYAARYNKFKREAEAVLNSEPLPMGHRETVRTYFEAIRPNSETDELTADE